MASSTDSMEPCSVCYIEPPKYRCPSCKVQTCSLPCYKKHQQRNSCNGRRDPAAYIKRSQWATPSGLDQDYNYLKGVERTIDATGREVRERGIGTDPSVSRNVARGWRADSVLQRYLSKYSIKVEHAPQGMSRQRNNNTRPTKSNRIVWTVEWVTGDGESATQHDCAENDSLASLFAAQRVEQHAISSASSQRASKRRRKGGCKPMTSDQDTTVAQSTHTDSEAPLPETDQSELPVEWAIEAPPEGSLTKDCDEGGNPLERKSSAEAERSPELHFYLRRPGTASAEPVLIPLRAGWTLTETLREHTVYEYPSIYVLTSSADELPPKYVLEKTYVQIARVEEARLRELEVKAAESASKNAHVLDDREAPKLVDASSVLDMLKRDLGR